MYALVKIPKFLVGNINVASLALSPRDAVQELLARDPREEA